ncbi:MAG TPA: type III pantothenate kinase [Saprospiraceae bacterium]|nr:type III pantothenate kinase [Saprospiraceae bacterium]
MLLAIDIGNTSVKYGIFDRKGELLWQDVLSEASIPSRIIKKYSVKSVIYSATGNISDVIMAQIKGFEHQLELTHKTPIPIQSKYTTPQTLGRDRMAAVCGAHWLLPGQNLLIVDAGTCLTYEVLSEDGTYLGGNIAPGLKMRLQAMHEFTAKLPIVSLSLPKELIGTSTKTALQNGAVRGSLMEITDFRRRIQLKMGQTSTILTGGDAIFLAKNLKFKTFVHQNLVLTGLYSIYAYNYFAKA